jgi:hypothetical protein
MAKIIKFILVCLIFSFTLNLSAKEAYIITLKGGTKIKAYSYIEKDDYIKVFKYGGYIIYPKKNVKKIEKINSVDVKNQSKNINATDNKGSAKKAGKKKPQINKCMPIVKNFESLPVYDKKKDGFNIKVTGIIENNCPKLLEDIKLTVNFFDEKNNKILTKTLPMKDITSYDSYKFEKIITDNYKGDIKYYNYKLEFLKK